MAKVTLVLVSVVIALLLLEFTIRLFSPQPINHYNFTLIQAEGGGEMLLESNILAGRHRTKGYGPYIPNLSTNFGGVAVTINSRGWRDTEHSLEKPPGVTRIMVVGDSVAFGYGVPLNDMFPKMLERDLNRQAPGRHEVISLGGAGGNTYAQKKIISDNAAIYDPDLVILAFNLNDILPNIFRRKTVRSSDVDGSISRSISRISFDVRKTLDTGFRSRSHLYFMLRERMKVSLRRFGIVSPTGVPLAAFDIEGDSGVDAWWDTREALLEIAEQLRKDQVRFLLAILPVDMQLSPKIADIYRRQYGFVFNDSLVAGKPQKMIADFARQHGIACIDLLSSFRKDPEEKKFFRIYGASIDWNHPNQVGHKIIATELAKILSALAAPPRTNDTAGAGSDLSRKQKRKSSRLVPVVFPDNAGR